MSYSNAFIADATYSSMYTPSDKSESWVDIAGTTMRIADFRTPLKSSDTGTKGELCVDSDYIYYCVATDTWVRAALNTSTDA